MKKIYSKPAMRVVQLHQRCILCDSDNRFVRSTSTNLTGDDAIEYEGSDSEYIKGGGYVR